MAKSSQDPDELGVCGTVRFGPELFREMTVDEEQLAGMIPGNVCYTGKGINLLAFQGQTIELTLRQTLLST